MLLIDHIFSGQISFEIRNILAVTLPYILECKIKPFPFKKFGQFFINRPNDDLSFIQHINDKSVEYFSEQLHKLSFVDQRNFSIDATLQFKNFISCNNLRSEQKKVDDDLKTIPV